MLVHRWTRDAVLARMAAETALMNVTDITDRDRASSRLQLETIRHSVEDGAMTSEHAAEEFDALRRRLTRAA